jgi:ribosome-associated toxin RatA of RatAB toxin-antitoxin module
VPLRCAASYTFLKANDGERRVELTRSVLVPYSVESMFDLIEQAEDYPMFLPWCVGARIIERSDDWVAARIEFSYLQLRFGFETRNPKRRPDWLQVRLVEGPFRHFQGDWHLTRLGDQGCKVSFSLACEVSQGLLERISMPAVERVSRSMIDAFVQRAEATLTAGSFAPTPAFTRVPVPVPVAVCPPSEKVGGLADEPAAAAAPTATSQAPALADPPPQSLQRRSP